MEKLYQKLKGRSDILTLSVDQTAYLAEAYMKEEKYAFPVIVSKGLAERLFPVTGFPQEWIIKRRRASFVARAAPR